MFLNYTVRIHKKYLPKLGKLPKVRLVPTATTRTKRKSANAERQLRRLWGSRIAQQRQLLKISRRELADNVGVTEQAVGAWERGESAPKPGMQAAIARELSVAWSILFAPEAAA